MLLEAISDDDLIAIVNKLVTQDQKLRHLARCLMLWLPAKLILSRQRRLPDWSRLLLRPQETAVVSRDETVH